jgi:pimeloyl-ACP methyl ester carboxylesterase
LSLLLVALSLLAAAPPAFPKIISLETSDGLKIAALSGIAPKATVGIAFVHMLGGSKEQWQITADSAWHQGMTVIAPDLRGHGANVTAPAPALTSADYYAMTRDVQTSVNWLRAQGATKVALVGASIGANLALRVAADDPAISSVVLLSPGLDYKGVTTRDALQRYGKRPILILASSEDSYAARSSTSLDGTALGPHQLLMLNNAGHGTSMLNRDPTLQGTILGFVKLNTQ